MIRSLAALLILSTLPSCVASIGNEHGMPEPRSRASEALLQEQIEAAKRIIELREQSLELTRSLASAGHGASTDAIEAEIELLEARIRLFDLRLELRAAQARPDADD